MTGSSLAILAAPIAIILSMPFRWISGVLILLGTSWPVLNNVDLPVLQRSLAFLTALSSMEIGTIVDADQSGAMRVMPLLVYLNKVNIGQFSAWYGQGLAEIAYYIQGELIGAGDMVAAGFIPGFLIAFGIIGTAFFVYIYLLRFLTKKTFPLTLLWLFLFATAAWNSQLFWYGLMLYRAVYYYLVENKAEQKQTVNFGEAPLSLSLTRSPQVLS